MTQLGRRCCYCCYRRTSARLISRQRRFRRCQQSSPLWAEAAPVLTAAVRAAPAAAGSAAGGTAVAAASAVAGGRAGGWEGRSWGYQYYWRGRRCLHLAEGRERHRHHQAWKCDATRHHRRYRRPAPEPASAAVPAPAAAVAWVSTRIGGARTRRKSRAAALLCPRWRRHWLRHCHR